MYLIIDNIEWDNIKDALILDLPLSTRRKVAQSIEPFPLVKFCFDCNKGQLKNHTTAWGLLKNNKLCHVVFDEETADKFIEAMGKEYFKRELNIGWK